MRASVRWFVLAVILASALAPLPLAAGTIKCGTSIDTTATVQQVPVFERFYPVRSGTQGVHLIWRDVEFMWDSSYAGGLTNDVRNTLRKLAQNLVDSTGKNPFRAPFSDFRLLYDYFRREGSFYTLNPLDTSSVRVGWFDRFVGGVDTTYNPSDRSHADCYVFNNAVRGFAYGGIYPSSVNTADEDLSSGRGLGDVKPANTLGVEGPLPTRTIDLTGSGWTAPDSIFNVGFNHEFQHSLPTQSPGMTTEMFSAGAEAIGGNADTSSVVDEVAYTWSLIGRSSGQTCTTVRAVGSNYQGRSAFMAYLAYNFRGTDTSATFAGLNDDLLRRWARSGRTFADLRRLLRNDSCGTCVNKTYFHPGGVALNDTSRLALLLHNWRVANYVNNSALAEGQYGFPPQFGFAPSTHLKAWQDLDNCATDDLVAIPPEVTLTATEATRERHLVGERSFRGNSHPLALQPLGSEYWVIRADPSAWSPNQDLVVRVSPEGIHRVRRTLGAGPCSTEAPDARLLASVVAYSPPAGSAQSGRLWEHPEWAARAFDPRWVDVDSSAGSLEFVVPSFGDSFKAALVVISLADGPSQFYATTNGIGYLEALPYRVDLALRRAPYQASNPLPLVTSTYHDDEPAWSPSDTAAVVFTRNLSGTPTIFRKKLDGSPETPLVATPGQPQSHPDWSPRGDWVAFSLRKPLQTSEDIWAYNVQSTELRRITVIPGFDFRPVFQPNGQRLAYTHRTSVNGNPGPWHLRRVDLSGANDTALVLRGDTTAIRSPRWSPDGLWIYFTSSDSLYVVGVDGANRGNVRSMSSLMIGRVTTFDLPLGNGPLVLEQPGSHRWFEICQDASGTCCTVLPTAREMPFRRLALRDTLTGDTQARFYRTGAEFFHPRWSFDGTRVVYSSDENAPGGQRDLYVGQVSYNHAPRFQGLGDVAVSPGTAVQMTVNATDADGESLTYDVPARYWPPGASFNPATRVFSWPSPGPQGSQHFVVFRAFDPSGGVATRVVRFTVTLGPIADLNADLVGETEVWLTWTAPGGAEYDLRYAPFPMTEYTFANGSRVTTSTPAAPGTPENQEVAGLSSCTPYWFAIKTKDSFGSWSALSNVLGVPTMCGGGGGGFRAQRAGSPLFSAGGAPPALVRPGSPDPAQAALAIEMSLPDGFPRWSLCYLSADQVGALAGADSASVLLQTWGEDGAWRKRTHIVLAGGGQRLGVRALKRAGRIVFLGPYDLQQTWSAVEFASPGRDSVVSIAAVQSSRRGDVRSSIDGDGSSALDLAAGDTLRVAYAPGMNRDVTPQGWFFIVGPPGSEVAAAGLRRPGLSEQAPLPAAFALRQNHPNPFSGRTTIRFELPVASPVRLEVFDLQGRRVAVLAEGQLAAGYHVIEWNRQDGNGAWVRSGVYLYRLTAGAFRDRKKMALLTP